MTDDEEVNLPESSRPLDSIVQQMTMVIDDPPVLVMAAAFR